MSRRKVFSVLSVALVAAFLVFVPTGAGADSVATPEVFVTGLNNPRGLTFGRDGALYIAEGGTGGTLSTVGQCDQAEGDVGPYSGGYTASITKVSPSGKKTILAAGLPSSQTSAKLGSLVSGVADVKFGGSDGRGELYALIAGAGCSHGLAGTSNEIVRVHRDGSTTQVADLSAFLADNPVENPDDNPVTGDFEPDGTWYSMVSLGGSFYAVEPNHQELDKITRDGDITRVVDFSTFFPGNTDWRGPTVVRAHHGSLYIGTLTPFPVEVGKAEVFKVDPQTGNFSVYASGLTTVLGLDFGKDGSLYVLEMSAQDKGPAPNTGKIVRIKGDQRQTIADGLNFPTAMTFGPDGNLYVSVNGFGSKPGEGNILKVAVHAASGEY